MLDDDPRLTTHLTALSAEDLIAILDRVSKAAMMFTVDFTGSGELTRVPTLEPTEAVRMLRSMADQIEAHLPGGADVP